MINEICFWIEGSWVFGVKLKFGYLFNIFFRIFCRVLFIFVIILSIFVLKIVKIVYVFCCVLWLYVVESISGVGNFGDGVGGGVNIY